MPKNWIDQYILNPLFPSFQPYCKEKNNDHKRAKIKYLKRILMERMDFSRLRYDGKFGTPSTNCYLCYYKNGFDTRIKKVSYYYFLGEVYCDKMDNFLRFEPYDVTRFNYHPSHTSYERILTNVIGLELKMFFGLWSHHNIPNSNRKLGKFITYTIPKILWENTSNLRSPEEHPIII